MPGSSDNVLSRPVLDVFISQTFGCIVASPVASSIESPLLKARILLSHIFNLNNFLSTPLGILSFSSKDDFTVSPLTFLYV